MFVCRQDRVPVTIVAAAIGPNDCLGRWTSQRGVGQRCFGGPKRPEQRLKSQQHGSDTCSDRRFPGEFPATATRYGG